MKDKVYPSAAIAEHHDSFVWAYLNVDLAATRKVMSYFQIRGVPFITIIAPDGEHLESNTGLIKSDRLSAMIQSALIKNGLKITPQYTPQQSGSDTKGGIFKNKPN